MLHVLIGEDDFSIRQALEKIKKSIGDPSALMTNTTELDGRQVTVEQLKNACETVLFLADKRLVIVEGLLTRFEPKGRPVRKKSNRSNNGQSDLKEIADCVNRVPDFTELVLIDGRINDRNPLLSGLSGAAKIRSFPLLNQARLKQWIERRVNETGGNISPQAIDLLVRFVGNSDGQARR